MKKKKLLSLMTAICVFICSRSVSSSAFYGYDNINSDGSIIDDSKYSIVSCVDAYEFDLDTFPNEDRLSSYDKIYLRNDGKELLAYKALPDYISIAFDTPPNDTVIENVKALVSGIDSNAIVSAESLYVRVNNISSNSNGNMITKELISVFTDAEVFYYYQPYIVNNRVMTSLCEYAAIYKPSIIEYIEKTPLDVTVQDVAKDGVESFVLISDSASATGMLEVANSIFHNTGIRPNFSTLESTGGGVGKYIASTNYFVGDANCDRKVTVSDAVAVLQYIANAEKYPLSEQAKFNADIDGEEGITGGDASAIQKIDAGIWDE